MGDGSNKKPDLTRITETENLGSEPAPSSSPPEQPALDQDAGALGDFGIPAQDFGEAPAPDSSPSSDPIAPAFDANPLDNPLGGLDLGAPPAEPSDANAVPGTIDSGAPFSFDPPPSDPSTPPEADPAASNFTLGAMEPQAEAPAAAPAPATPPAPAAAAPLANVAKKASQPKPRIPAQFPFSLLIEGPLEPENRDRLIELLNAHDMGIREIDLEPQFAAGRVLVPRISEYAGVLLVQALRGSSARLKLGPSDEIFAAKADPAAESGTDPGIPSEPPKPVSQIEAEDEHGHPAERMPLTAGDSIPGRAAGDRFSVVDTITASAAIQSKLVHAEGSQEYQRVLDALQRELKYKAYRKGAQALIRYQLQLHPLSPPTHYRAVAAATAVTTKTGSKKAPKKEKEVE